MQQIISGLCLGTQTCLLMCQKKNDDRFPWLITLCYGFFKCWWICRKHRIDFGLPRSYRDKDCTLTGLLLFLIVNDSNTSFAWSYPINIHHYTKYIQCPNKTKESHISLLFRHSQSGFHKTSRLAGGYIHSESRKWIYFLPIWRDLCGSICYYGTDLKRKGKRERENKLIQRSKSYETCTLKYHYGNI